MQSATVTLKDDGIIEVRHGPGSERFAGYLAKTLEQLNNPQGARRTLLAKAELGGIVLEANALKREKARLLRDQSQSWSAKSRETNLTSEVRQYLESKARAARKAAEEIERELAGPKA
jgi:hypothetical protein